MLKTRVGDELWLVHQPDHGRLAGYLAAHWGGATGFARPGHFAPFDRPDELRQEVVQAVAEHDNGWWEWEASPPIDPADGWPPALADVGRRDPAAGLLRWRFGVPRLADAHPYVALLISLHAYYLYAFALREGLDDALRHPLFGSPDHVKKMVADPDLTRAFLREQAGVQRGLAERVRERSEWAPAAEPDHLHPNFRLLQLLDALSLFLSFGAQQPLRLPDVPRVGWHDRCAIELRPVGGSRVVCDPFPFDAAPLEVYLPARVVPAAASGGEWPLARLHALPLRTIRFELVPPE
jgi:hypothetical protein